MYFTKNFHPGARNINGIIEDLLTTGKVFTDELWNEDRMHVPVNIIENEASFELQVFAPGVKKEEFKLNVEKNVLTISYEHKQEPKDEKDSSKILRKEFKQRSFKRSFTLSDKIANTGINAKYNDGILTVVLPKKEQTENPTQEISVA